MEEDGSRRQYAHCAKDREVFLTRVLQNPLSPGFGERIQNPRVSRCQPRRRAQCCGRPVSRTQNMHLLAITTSR